MLIDQSRYPLAWKFLSSYFEGLNYSDVEDSNNDGYFDDLVLGFGVNSTALGNYMIEGTLTDCAGNLIDQFNSSARAQWTRHNKCNCEWKRYLEERKMRASKS